MDDATRRALVERLIDDQTAMFRAVRADWTRDWLTNDLTLTQMKVLLLLEVVGETSMSQLAEALNKAQPTVTGIVDRLVEQGLVARAESLTDRRVTLVHLAEPGRDLVVSLAQAREVHARRWLSQLSGTELRLVADAFAVLRRVAEADAAADRPPGCAALAVMGEATRERA